MEDIIIKLLDEAEIQELFKFEIENRAFYARMVSSSLSEIVNIFIRMENGTTA